VTKVLATTVSDGSRGESLCGGAVAGDYCEAVQAGGERDFDNLEAADGGGKELPEAECAGVDGEGGYGSHRHQQDPRN
jgi:hypothetical protein